MDHKLYSTYVQILTEELVPAALCFSVSAAAGTIIAVHSITARNTADAFLKKFIKFSLPGFNISISLRTVCFHILETRVLYPKLQVISELF